MLTIEHLTKTFTASKGEESSHVLAVNDLSLDVQKGQMLTLLGPSGCGKTTTLRCVAGLEHPDSGEITVGGRVLFSDARRIRVPPNRRGLGMVFQSYAIWPHMNVFDNAAFPLRCLPRKVRPSKQEIKERVERALSVVKLESLAGRPATKLSGGQQQRLALVRALVLEPPLLLLDEPLSNLDAKLREGMRFELKRLQRQLGITAVYVTHDQIEALSMSNQIAVMNQGVVEQIGRPRDIYEKPRTPFVAGFVGTSNLVEGTIETRLPDGAYRVRASAGMVDVASPFDLAAGDKVLVSIRPEQIGLTTGETGAGIPGTWAGKVLARAYMGDAVEHLIGVSGVEIRARSNASVSIPDGTPVVLTLNRDWCTLVPQ